MFMYCQKVLGGMRGMTGLLWETSLLDPEEVYTLLPIEYLQFFMCRVATLKLCDCYSLICLFVKLS